MTTSREIREAIQVITVGLKALLESADLLDQSDHIRTELAGLARDLEAQKVSHQQERERLEHEHGTFLATQGQQHAGLTKQTATLEERLADLLRQRATLEEQLDALRTSFTSEREANRVQQEKEAATHADLLRTTKAATESAQEALTALQERVRNFHADLAAVGGRPAR